MNDLPKKSADAVEPELADLEVPEGDAEHVKGGDRLSPPGRPAYRPRPTLEPTFSETTTLK